MALERILNSAKAIAYSLMGSNSLPPIDQENQTRRKEDTISNTQEIRTEEVDKAHVNEDAKTPASRDKTKLNLHKTSVEVRKETHKPDAQPGAEHGPSTNGRHQRYSLADEIASLRKQLELMKHNLAQATQTSGELQRKLTREKDDSHRMKMDAEKQIRDLHTKNQKIEEELKMLKGTLRGAQEKQSHTAKLLEERTADLKGAQTFLTTADRYAGAEIIKMVEALNAEIFQGAALISDLLEEAETLEVDEQKKDAKGVQGAKGFLTQYIGPTLVEHLSTKSKEVQIDPLPLQLTVQTILTSWCAVMVNRFCGGSAANDLSEIYRRIWESEPQAVAGRWRAMTIGQAKHMDSTTNEDLVIKILFTLLRLCGSPMTNLNSQKTNLRLQQVVSPMVDMWMQLRTAIYEGITTTEMRVFYPSPNDIYQDAVMNDIYDDADSVRKRDLGKEAGRIMCAVGMGLQRSVIKRNGDGTMSFQTDTILKAKVAFASVLVDAA